MHLLLNKHSDLPLFVSNLDIPFILLLKELKKIMCLKTDLLLEIIYLQR